MREYKFRGKRKDNGEWVYGNYFIDERDIEDGFIWRDIPQIQQRYGDHYQYYDVDPSTIGQYTGLKDKNGTEIYEGDITKDPGGNVFEVVWNKGATSFELQNKISHFLFVQRYIDMFEVIGNIYDNPELLKEVE